MSIMATCTHCQNKAKVRDELAGRTVKCPKCKESFRIPRLAGGSTVSAAESSVTRVPPVARKQPPRRSSAEDEDDDDDESDEEDSQDEERPGRLPPRLSGSALAGVLTIGLVLSIVINIGFAYVAYESIKFFSRRLVPSAEMAKLESTINIVQWAVRIMLGFLFLVWINRVVANCRLLGVRGLQFSANWAVGLWLVPILNVVLSWSLLQELWQASDPKNLQGDRRTWRRQPPSILAMVWCAVFWACFLLEFVTRMMMIFTLAEMRETRQADFDGILLIQTMFMIAAALSVAAAGLFIIFAMQLDDRQKKKLKALRKAAGLDQDSDDDDEEDEEDEDEDDEDEDEEDEDEEDEDEEDDEKDKKRR